MKKLFTSVMLLVGSLAATATDYLGTLVVVIDGNVAQPTQTQITLDEQTDGKYGLTLKNFILVQGDDAVPVGNIVLKDIVAETVQDAMVLETKQDIKLEEGDAEGVDFWLSTAMTDPIPVELKAVVKDGALSADIVVPIANQDVKVVFDSREFQLPNSGFEKFHTAKAGSAESQEPNNWHSFMSCTGSLSSVVSGVPHTFVSEDVRPGSEGSKSVLVKSGKVLGAITANGTLTTGQLKAGGMSATSTDNNAFLDLSNEAKDENGDPFYTILNTLPDSIGVWVKFKQGQPVAEHPYATMSAVITDGSYYQEPADKDYSDVIVGKAECKTIASTGEWQKIIVPFKYTGNKLPKGILVTFSTNADAGEGTGEDELYLDDVELVYSSYLSDLSVNNATLPGFTPNKYDYEYNFAEGTMPTADELVDAASFVTGNEAKTFVSVQNNVVSILVLSADLLTNHTYTIKFAEGAAGVENIINSDNTSKAVYTLDGQKVDTMKKGGIYITKYANGKTVKAVNK